jgi:hypothetical protein
VRFLFGALALTTGTAIAGITDDVVSLSVSIARSSLSRPTIPVPHCVAHHERSGGPFLMGDSHIALPGRNANGVPSRIHPISLGLLSRKHQANRTRHQRGSSHLLLIIAAPRERYFFPLFSTPVNSLGCRIPCFHTFFAHLILAPEAERKSIPTNF